MSKLKKVVWQRTWSLPFDAENRGGTYWLCSQLQLFIHYGSRHSCTGSQIPVDRVNRNAFLKNKNKGYSSKGGWCNWKFGQINPWLPYTMHVKSRTWNQNVNSDSTGKVTQPPANHFTVVTAKKTRDTLQMGEEVSQKEGEVESRDGCLKRWMESQVLLEGRPLRIHGRGTR